jgi:ElaB/YqjD/DUF883 family membrane-anchored ribosome-binding protein
MAWDRHDGFGSERLSQNKGRQRRERKMRLFIANVGARDLQVKINGRLYSLDVRPYEKEKAQVLKDFLSRFFNQQTPNQLGVRVLGEWLLKQNQGIFQKFLEEVVACPILEPALDLALGEAKTLDVVYLLGTDQPDDAPANLRANDTYWAAEIIKQWLYQCYKNREKLGQVCVLKISGIVPVLWDKAYQLIASLKVVVDENQEVELRELLQQSQEVFAEISGGIPALNFALHQVVLNVCSRKARIVQVLEGEGRAHLLKIQVFWGDRLIRQLETLLKSYDYKAAIDLLENEIPKDQQTEQIQKAIAALRHADARLNFDFQQALRAIEAYINEEPFQGWYNSANHQTFADRVREALECLEIFRRSSRLITFIALADGIVEGLTRLVAEILVPELPSIYFDENDQLISDLFDKSRLYVDLDKLSPELKDHLQTKLVKHEMAKDRPLALANEYFYKSIISYHNEKLEVQRINTVIGQLRSCLNDFRDGLLHRLANLSEDSLKKEISRHFGNQYNDLSAIIDRLKTIFIDRLLELADFADNPCIFEQIKKAADALQQGFNEGLVFDDINQFVLQTLSKAWEVPLPPQ